MALAIDSQMPSNAGQGTASAASLSYSFTNTAGTIIYVWLGLGVSGATTAPTPAATYNSVSMAQILQATTSGGATGGKLTLFRLLVPATGSNTVALTWGGTSVLECWSGAISFTGNNTTTPEVQTNSATGSSSSASVALSGVASGNITIACAGAGTSMSAQTQSLDWAKNVDNGSSMGNGRASTSASTGSVTHAFTIGGSDSWVAIIAEVASAGGAAATIPNLVMAPYIATSAG